MFDLVIINDDLEEAYEKLKSVLMEVTSCVDVIAMHFSTCSIYLK